MLLSAYLWPCHASLHAKIKSSQCLTEKQQQASKSQMAEVEMSVDFLFFFAAQLRLCGFLRSYGLRSYAMQTEAEFPSVCFIAQSEKIPSWQNKHFFFINALHDHYPICNMLFYLKYKHLQIYCCCTGQFH